MKTCFPLVTGCLAVLLGTTAGRAADLPVRQAPVPPPLPFVAWTGFYAGGHLGAVIDDSNLSLIPTGAFLATPGRIAVNPFRTRAFRADRADVTGGVQIGYNFQIDRLVVGIEADIGHGNTAPRRFSSVLAAPLAAGTTFGGRADAAVDYFGTVRGRLGYTFDNLLLFGTGGFAYGQTRTDTDVTFSAAGDRYVGAFQRTETGYAYGGGIEYKFTPSVSIRAEYLHVDLGRARGTGAPSVFAGENYTYDTARRTAFDVARVALNYHFFTP